MEEKDYSFDLLKDEAVNIDAFPDKTHERIAKTLYNIISNKNADGVTIGLEGPWGSGKSTVISILKEKLENDDFLFFYFDAWAHEGDPLRRIFLKSLIQQFSDSDGKLKEINSQLNNPKQKKEIKSKQTVTLLGKITAVCSLFVPAGVVFLSRIDFNNFSLNLKTILGILLPSFPLIFLFLNLMRHFLWKIGNIIFNAIRSLKNIFHDSEKNKKTIHKIWTRENWQFLSGEYNVNVVEEVLKNGDRTSIEFEEHFKKILKVLLDNNGKKLIIVIDNLDRIDSEDSLSIWSTLQTFLQQRNPSNLKNKVYNKIWIIVPYDFQGLSKLWRNEINCESDNKEDKDEKKIQIDICALSFFEKCFQLRIDVPKPILTEWESFAKEKIDEAFKNWLDNEKKDIFSILRNTRDDLADVPTPRQIKTYINQVGILRMHSSQDIPIQSIAYYVVFKYIKGHIDADTIREKILKKELPRKRDLFFVHPECSKHLAGLVFGVDSNKGQQLLLEPKIENALSSGEGRALDTILKEHNEGFWAVFRFHISRKIDAKLLIPYSKAIYESIWKTDREKCNGFIKRVHNVALSFPDENTINFIVPLINMLNEAGYNLEEKWAQIIRSLENDFSKSSLDIPSVIDFCVQVITSFGTQKLTKLTLNVQNITVWEQWTIETEKKDLDLYKLISPSITLVDELITKIQPGQIIEDNIYRIIRYMINAGIKEWISFIDICTQYIKWNRGEHPVEFKSAEILHILYKLVCVDDSCADKIKDLLKIPDFHNFVHHQRINGSVLYASLLMAHFFKNELHSIDIPLVKNSANGMKAIRDFWFQRNKENADEVWGLLSEHQNYSIVWDMAEDKNNELLMDLIPLCMRNDGKSFFNVKNCLHKLYNTISIIERECKKEIVKRFIKYSKILDEIKNDEELDLITYSEGLYLIINEIDNNQKIEKNIIQQIKAISKNEWFQALAENTYLLSLAVALINKKQNINLENNYFDAIFDYANRWIANEIEPTEWIINNWTTLVKVLRSSFQSRFKYKVTEILWSNLSILKLGILEHFLGYFDVQKTIKNKIEIIQDFIDKVSKNEGDFNRLKIIDLVLGKDKQRKFEPHKDFSEYINSPINDLYQKEQNNEEHKKIILRIAECLNVPIKIADEEKEDADMNPATAPENE